MRSGSCPKCGSTEIRTTVSGFASGDGAGLRLYRKVLPIRSATDDYVCMGCGYVERYLRPGKALSWIGTNWYPVPHRTRASGEGHMAVRDRMSGRHPVGDGLQDQVPDGNGVQDRIPGGFEPHPPEDQV